MEVKRPEQYELKIEKDNPNFNIGFESLKNLEVLKENEAWKESRKIKDKYKEKVQLYALDKGIDPKSIKELPPDMLLALEEELADIDNKYTKNGVHFLYCQFYRIIESLKQGKRVEFEAMGPYIADYNMATGEIWENNLTKTDKIGLELMKYLRNLLPEAKPISLYDEYNTVMRDSSLPSGKPTSEGPAITLPEDTRQAFKKNLEKLFRNNGVIHEDEIEGPEADFLLISETEKTKDAPSLVESLEKMGLIEYGAEEEIWFQNNIVNCEDPRYLRVKLRDKKGKWECAALDASGFLHPRNREITHLVILPKENFQEQQGQVWEILRVLGIEPINYHNIFFEVDNKDTNPKSVVETVNSVIKPLLI